MQGFMEDQKFKAMTHATQPEYTAENDRACINRMKNEELQQWNWNLQRPTTCIQVKTKLRLKSDFFFFTSILLLVCYFAFIIPEQLNLMRGNEHPNVKSCYC